jgi:hypothetical protein
MNNENKKIEWYIRSKSRATSGRKIHIYIYIIYMVGTMW